MYMPVPGIEPSSSVFLGECVTHSGRYQKNIPFKVMIFRGLDH